MFNCEESQLPISNTMELLGVTIDDKLNFEKQIAKICSQQVSQQVAILLMTLSIPKDRNTPITDGVVLEFTNNHAGKQTNQMTQNFFEDLEYTDGSKCTNHRWRRFRIHQSPCGKTDQSNDTKFSI